jgi:hypothetical protein
VTPVLGLQDANLPFEPSIRRTAGATIAIIGLYN